MAMPAAAPGLGALDGRDVVVEPGQWGGFCQAGSVNGTPALPQIHVMSRMTAAVVDMLA
jgi:hypothetical protein